MDIVRLSKEYYQQLYAHKLEKVDEMNQYLERCNWSKLTLEEIDYMKRHIYTYTYIYIYIYIHIYIYIYIHAQLLSHV